MKSPSVQIDRVARLEARLVAARQKASASLRRVREARKLSLRAASAQVRLSPAGLSLLETGQSWQTDTARRVMEFYRSTAEAA